MLGIVGHCLLEQRHHEGVATILEADLLEHCRYTDSIFDCRKFFQNRNFFVKIVFLVTLF